MPLSSNNKETTIEGMDALQRDAVNTSIDMNVSGDNMTETERQMREEELSFYTNSENEHGDDNIWGLLSGVGGNIYEW
jgi:hypothetical protein